MRELQSLQECFDFTAFGIETEKYISKLDALETKVLKPYRQVHYLVSIDINDHDKLLALLEPIKKIEGVKIDCTLN